MSEHESISRTKEDKKVTSESRSNEAETSLKDALYDFSPGMSLKRLQTDADNSPRLNSITQLQASAEARATYLTGTIQRQENNTGLPDNLKSGMENLSGLSMDDVEVHRNSDKPAKLQAHAYAQGTDIHLGPGQEKHLPHELGHVVQQKQGRVKPTMQKKGKVNINDDTGLEKEADLIGNKALVIGKVDDVSDNDLMDVSLSNTSAPIQGVWNIVVRWVGREMGKEIAREAMLRFARGELKNVLDGLGADVLKEVTKELQNNPQIREILSKAELGKVARDALQHLTAPLTEQIRRGIGYSLDKVIEVLPYGEQRDAFSAEFEKRKTEIYDYIDNSKVLSFVSPIFEIGSESLAPILTQLGAMRGINFLGDSLLGSVIEQGKDTVSAMATEATGGLIKSAEDAISKAAEIEKVLDGIPDFVKALHRPMRGVVKKGFETYDNAVGNVASGIQPQSASQMAELLKSGKENAIEGSIKSLSESSPSGYAKYVKHGAQGLQAAFVLSEIARAKTYTDTTIAMLKPLAAMGGATFGGAGAVILPILVEKTLKRFEDKIEPWLKEAGESLKKIPGVETINEGVIATGKFLNTGGGLLMDGVGASLSLVTNQISSLMHNLHSLTSNVISNATSGESENKATDSDTTNSNSNNEDTSSVKLGETQEELPDITLDIGDLISRIIEKRFAVQEDIKIDLKDIMSSNIADFDTDNPLIIDMDQNDFNPLVGIGEGYSDSNQSFVLDEYPEDMQINIDDYFKNSPPLDDYENLIP